MIKVGEVEEDSDLYYVYKIKDDEFHCLVLTRFSPILNDGVYYEDNMLLGDLVRKIVPNNVLSKKVYPDAVVDNGDLFTHPHGSADYIEEFVERCKKHIKEKGL